MALDTAFYLVTRDIALRSGLIQSRYRIADGRFVLDNKDLSRVRLTADEYVNGLSGIEKVSEAEAMTLIAKNGYKRGGSGSVMNTNVQEEPQEAPVERAGEGNGGEEVEVPTEEENAPVEEENESEEEEETETDNENDKEE